MEKVHKYVFDDLWGELVRGKADSKHAFRYVTLATVNYNQKPEARTVVLRDVIKENSTLIFFTDNRSPKFLQLKANSSVALLFYNQKNKMQLRITGSTVLYTRNKIAAQYLHQISQTDLKDYRTATSPGSDLTYGTSLYKGREAAVENFAVIEVKADKIDFLKLDMERHERIIFEQTGTYWSAKSLVP